MDSGVPSEEKANWEGSVSWKPGERSRSRKRQQLTPPMLLTAQLNGGPSTGFHHQ